MSEQEVKKEEVVQPSQPSLQDFLAKLPGAPDQMTIEKWKTQYGDVLVCGFSETEIYVWRPLTRGEHRSLQAGLQSAEGSVDQLRYEEMVCDVCVLYPKNINWEQTKGGTASTLSEQIFQNSNFVNPQAASVMVIKL